MAGKRLMFVSPSAPAASTPAPAEPHATPTQAEPQATPTQVELPADASRAYAFVQGTPIRYFTPQLTPAKAVGEAKTLQHRKILFLTDQPEQWLALENSGALNALDYKVVCPSGVNLTKSVPVDLSSEENLRNSLSGLAGWSRHAPRIKAMAGHTKETGSRHSESALRWPISVRGCRQSSSDQRESMPVVAVVRAHIKTTNRPYTGWHAALEVAVEEGAELSARVNTEKLISKTPGR